MTQEADNHIAEALQVLNALGLPRAQQNERSALSLLALLNLTPTKQWKQSESPMMGITPIMDWMSQHYGKSYKPNTRETIRDETIHPFVNACIAQRNPDKPERSTNSRNTVYQISPEILEVLKTFGSSKWKTKLKKFLTDQPTLAERYAKPRKLKQIPVRLKSGQEISLSPGKHSELIKSIIYDFGSCFVPNGQLIYVGDTGKKWGHFEKKLLTELGVTVDIHGRMPDVILFYPKRQWLILVEAVTSNGPVDGKRHEELARLFSCAKVGLVYVTAFPDRDIMRRHLGEIAWETEVWVADAPTHLIHFNGSRFLGPYS